MNGQDIVEYLAALYLHLIASKCMHGPSHEQRSGANCGMGVK